MSIYTCDVCGKSTIIDSTSIIPYTGCLLTSHCNGRLRINRNPSVTPTTQSVDRYALDIISQPLLSRIWRGDFNVSVQPTILIYKQTGAGAYSQITSGFTITIDSNDDLVIMFDEPTAGIAHVITHTSYRALERLAAPAVYDQITYNGVLTIAVPLYVPVPSNPIISIVDPLSNIEQHYVLDMVAHRSPLGITLFNTAWKTVDTVTIEGTVHRLFSCIIPSKVELYDGSYQLSSDHPILLSNKPHSDVADVDRKKHIPSGLYTGLMTRTELLIDSTQKSLYNIPIKTTSLIF